MRYIATALVSIILSAGVSVGITHTVMQEHNRQEVERVEQRAEHDVKRMEVDAFNDGFLYGQSDR